jgi:hypothetical protein
MADTPWADITQNTTSQSDQLARAQRLMREANRDEYQIILDVPGDVKWNAGTNVDFDESWGKFKGKFRLYKTLHRWDASSGYRCQLHFHKTLEGY